MITWTQMQTKAQRLARDSNDGTLTQLKEDMNTGYHLFNAKLSRYFSRKQQFTDLNDGQQIYQTPIDCIRVIGMTVAVSNTYQTPVKEIRSEYEWRQITAYPYNSNWPAFYFMIGNDELALWPTPSQDVTNGLRFYYQQQDHDLSVEDVTSTSTSTTVTVTNGSETVTATGAAFTAQMKGLWFQVTGVTDLTWYEIVDVPDTETLTLKSAFVGISGSAQAFRVGQLSILPEEYQDVPINYALYLYFSSKANEQRSSYHKGLYDTSLEEALEAYSSSTEGNVLTSDDSYINAWFVTPLPPNQ